MLSRLKLNLLVAFPFFRAKDLDFADLKLMYAHAMILSNSWRIHLAPGTVVVTVRSSLKALMRGCLAPDWLSGPLHCTVSVPLASMFIASAKRVTDNGATSYYAHFQLM